MRWLAAARLPAVNILLRTVIESLAGERARRYVNGRKVRVIEAAECQLAIPANRRWLASLYIHQVTGKCESGHLLNPPRRAGQVAHGEYSIALNILEGY